MSKPTVQVTAAAPSFIRLFEFRLIFTLLTLFYDFTNTNAMLRVFYDIRSFTFYM